jgi:hypothetical protein
LRRTPWYLWCAAAAVTCADIGGQWDIAWHRSIGRDAFWSPPHIAIYLCGVLAGIAAAYLILSATFSAARGGVHLWGFRGPLGAFVMSWGGIAMLASAPFDNWWHGAYGLDVKILSPPHVVLLLGIVAIQIGALILILGHMNRAPGEPRLQWLFLYIGGMILLSFYTGTMESTGRPLMHSATFYAASAWAFPAVLIGVARASGKRWAATLAAAIYSAVMIALLWILPLVSATPKLGPVLNPVTTLIPAGFPLLIIAPAFALDVLLARTARWNDWGLALVAALVFIFALLAAQWPFAEFLMSPAAHNWFFGAGYLDYRTGPQSYQARNLFRTSDGLARIVLMAFGPAWVMSRLGLAWGKWMRGIQR